MQETQQYILLCSGWENDELDSMNQRIAVGGESRGVDKTSGPKDCN
jgi:hypothetical protein